MDNLIPDLLWSSMPYLQNPHEATRLREWRAPSWSWASVDTQFGYEDLSEGGLKLMVVLTNVNVEPVGWNPQGEVRGGSLILTGLAVEGVLVAPGDYEFHYYLKLTGPASVEVCPDTLLVEQETQLGRTVRRAKQGEVYEPFSVPVTCLAIMATSDDCIYGLVLGHSPKSMDAYERVGLFSCGKCAFGKSEKKRICIV